MKKNNKTVFMAIIAVIVIAYLFRQPSVDKMSMMTFYDHKECLVYGGFMAGCEGSGMTHTTYFINNDNWGGLGSCTAFMNAYGCKPQNCNYMEGGECDGWNENNVLSRECSNDNDCIQRFGNTAWACAMNPINEKVECVFGGNHQPSENIQIFGINNTSEVKQESWVSKNAPVLAVIGTGLFMYFTGFLG